MNKWMLGIVVAVLPCVAQAASKAEVAQAKAIEAKFNQLFQAVDTNKDGKISKTEAEFNAPAMAENFEHIDTNQDNGLTKQEIKTFGTKLGKARRDFSQSLERADKDKNGMLSEQEAKVLPPLSTNFQEIDTNHDHQLVMKEIADFLRAKTPKNTATTEPVSSSAVAAPAAQ